MHTQSHAHMHTCTGIDKKHKVKTHLTCCPMVSSREYIASFLYQNFNLQEEQATNAAAQSHYCKMSCKVGGSMAAAALERKEKGKYVTSAPPLSKLRVTSHAIVCGFQQARWRSFFQTFPLPLVIRLLFP